MLNFHNFHVRSLALHSSYFKLFSSKNQISQEILTKNRTVCLAEHSHTTSSSLIKTQIKSELKQVLCESRKAASLTYSLTFLSFLRSQIFYFLACSLDKQLELLLLLLFLCERIINLRGGVFLIKIFFEYLKSKYFKIKEIFHCKIFKFDNFSL